MNTRNTRRIFVAGHGGMVGSAVVRRLEGDSGVEVVTRDRNALDLTDSQAVRSLFQGERIDEVYLCAAKVGGIHANSTYPADFIRDNLVIQTTVIHEAFQAGVSKLLFLGSSCIYPRDADQPMGETALLTGALEKTNEAYAIAKIAGIKLCEAYNRQHNTDFRALMPTNLYGPNDNFHPRNSHVIPALMRRFHEAVEAGDDRVSVWGTGNAMREFLHVDDLADACVFVMNLPRDTLAAATDPHRIHLNVGTGKDVTIRELATSMAMVTGFSGRIDYDSSRPDGTPRKFLDVSALRGLGWTASTELRDGLASVYRWYRDNVEQTRG